MAMTDSAVPSKLQLIPHGFETYKQFINWFPQQNGRKVEKIPCSPRGVIIDAHNPANWVTAAEAAASTYGIAFVFTPDDPFFFIDLDHAVDKSSGSPQWSALAQWAMATLPGAAVEISHSGEGLHLFGSGAGVLPREHRCRRKGFNLEIYSSWRFVALTGTGKGGTATTDFSGMLPEFMRVCGLDGERDDRVEALDDYQAPDAAFTGPGDDEVLVRLMCGSGGNAAAAFGGVHVRDLWEANVPALIAKWPEKDGTSYDDSTADAALMSHLAFWTGRDAPRMERLFKQSKLYRPSRYEGKGEYRLIKLLRLGVKVRKVYDRPSAAVVPLPGAAGTPDVPATSARSAARFMPVADQQAFFQGCFYVMNQHAIMMPDGNMASPVQFRAMYGGWNFEMDNAGKTTRNAFEAFTESRLYDFPKVKGSCFRPAAAPGAIINGLVNTWVPPVVDEAEGDVTPFLNHMKRLLPDPRDCTILLSYMKALKQFPGIKFQWAPVIQGAEGNGKTALIRVLSYAISDRYTHLPKANELAEKYNSFIEGNIFIGVEEINVSEKRETLEILKDAVTNNRLEIRGMRTDKRMADNYTNWLFLTNHKEAIPTNQNDRRYAIFFTAQQSAADLIRDGMTETYFMEFYDWLDAGGYRAVSWWLGHDHIDPEFNPAGKAKRAPSTSSKTEAIQASLGKIEQMILEAAEEGIEGFKDDWLSATAVRRVLEKRGVKTPGPVRINSIILSLGYVEIGRLTVTIVQEDNIRGRIYRRNGRGGTLEDYITDQGFRAPSVLNVQTMSEY